MKKLLVGIFASIFAVTACVVTLQTSAQDRVAVSPHLVISQFQAGGGVAEDEFIEIHNTSAAPIDLNGYKVVYRSATGSNDVGPMAQWTTSTIVPPGGFYLIATPSYDGPTPANLIYNPSVCACSMGQNGGGLAIRNSSDAIIDGMGWGTATNIFVEGAATTVPGNNNSKARKQSGCQDTDNNATDFETVTPSAPRNTSSVVVQCSGGGTNLFAAMSANPSTIEPNNNVLLTVTVIPAATPPSTGINVIGDLLSIGGSATQQFFDNGTNGDVTAGDNVWSFSYTIPANLTGGVRTVFGTATDAQARTVTVSTNISINAPLPDEDPLLLGNPTNATSDVANENNYLMIKPQYSLSYNRSRAIPNWTAWRLDSSWIGSADRQDDYRPDTSLPAGWYQVLDTDYSGSGYQRGHMCPSGDRTRSIPDNSATFLMTNLIPQYGPNNEGPWNDLENYLRSQAATGKEIYIFSGGEGSRGTIAQGRITVPNVTWKVVLILQNGANDLSRVNKATRAFGVIMPNGPPLTQGQQWRTYRTTVNAVELLTGYNFFSKVPVNTQEIIEQKRDRL